DLFLREDRERFYPRDEVPRLPGRGVVDEVGQVTAEDVHQDRLRLVVEVMAGSEFRRAGPPHCFDKRPAAQNAADGAALRLPPGEEPVEVVAEEVGERDDRMLDAELRRQGFRGLEGL